MPASANSTRLPRDVEARERLQQAQRAEAAAVADVYRAEAALTRAQMKFEATVAAATKVVDDAHAVVDRTQAALVAVSGRDRAAQLLGIDRVELRKGSAARGARSDD